MIEPTVLVMESCAGKKEPESALLVDASVGSGSPNTRLPSTCGAPADETKDSTAARGIASSDAVRTSLGKCATHSAILRPPLLSLGEVVAAGSGLAEEVLPLAGSTSFKKARVAGLVDGLAWDGALDLP